MRNFFARVAVAALFLAFATMPRAENCVATASILTRAATDGVTVDMLSPDASARARAIYDAVPPASDPLPPGDVFLFTFSSGVVLVGFEREVGLICANLTVQADRAADFRRSVMGEGI